MDDFFDNILSGIASLVFPSKLQDLMFVFRLILNVLITDLPLDLDDAGVIKGVYDFIVVGAGTAVCIVASRLSETGASVLLLEAGASATPETIVPSFPPIMIGTDLDWFFPLQSQKFAQQGYFMNASILTQGKVVGGGSSTGNLRYSRGSKHDYDHWAFLGNTGWDYKSVLPYFKKSESYKGLYNRQTERYHGRRGEMVVDEKRFKTGVGTQFLRAGKELGFDIIDENTEESVGFSPLYFTIKNGIRESVSEAFFKGLFAKKNFDVLTRATVQKIFFDRKGRTAGVVYKRKGRIVNVRVNNEVIVCAGAINTPKLLMLSGVGPRSHLRKKKIAVRASLEGVGKNLQDHHIIRDFPFTVDKGTAADNTPRNLDIQKLKNYAETLDGPLSRPYSNDGAAYVNLNGVFDIWPDLIIDNLNLANNDMGPYLIRYGLNMRPEAFSDLLEPLNTKTGMVLAPSLCRPKSRGWVLLSSNNPDDNPLIDFNFLSHPSDLTLIVKGLKFAMKIATTDAMKKVGIKFESKPLRWCRDFISNIDVYLECFARYMITTSYHPVGTCKMGTPQTDPLAVVDSRLRVHKLEGLRIADSSIMPFIPCAPPMAATMMVAEKAADMIKEDWGYETTPLDDI